VAFAFGAVGDHTNFGNKGSNTNYGTNGYG
jgi:hypothetical protein